MLSCVFDNYKLSSIHQDDRVVIVFLYYCVLLLNCAHCAKMNQFNDGFVAFFAQGQFIFNYFLCCRIYTQQRSGWPTISTTVISVISQESNVNKNWKLWQGSSFLSQLSWVVLKHIQIARFHKTDKFLSRDFFVKISVFEITAPQHAFLTRE